MKRLLLLALTVGCGAPAKPATSPASNHAPTTPKLGPRIAKADFDQRIAAHQVWHLDVERLPDEGGDVGPFADGPRVKVNGDVISALGCRPGGDEPAFLTDGHFVYLSQQSTRLSMPAGAGPMATPSTYCSFERFRFPHQLEYAGPLQVR